MSERDEGRQYDDELRRRAEEVSRGRPAPARSISTEEALRLLHELEVHQIELEMQNEELRLAQEQLETARARYFDLFDLAPVGYLTVSETGLILEANITAANLLGRYRSDLVRHPMTRFIHHDDQDIYYLHRRQVFATQEPQVCELRVLRKDPRSPGAQDEHPLWVRMQSASAEDSDGERVCRATLSDLTERKQTEERQAAAQQALLQQSEHLRLLHEIDRAILSAQTPEAIAHLAARSLREATGALQVNVALFDEQGDTVEILAIEGKAQEDLPAGLRLPGAAYRFEDANRRGLLDVVEDVRDLPDSYPDKEQALRAGVLSGIAAPMSVGGMVIGSLSLARDVSGPFSTDLIELLQQVADSLAIAIHSARLHEQVQASQRQLQRLSRRLVDREERERRYVADQLYNDAGQVLTALKIRIGQQYQQAPPPAQLAEIQDLLDRVMQELHHLATHLRPAVLDRLGLPSAIRQYAEGWGDEHGVEVRVSASDLEPMRMRDEAETAVYRVVQEVLMNIAEHAHAGAAEIYMSQADGKFTVLIEDDGIGFDPVAAQHHGAMGLLDVQERAATVGGKVTVVSEPGSGTAVTVVVPI